MAKKISKFLLVASFLAILVLPARTYAVDWFPLVPCGLNQQPANATRKDTLPDGTQVPHNYKQDCNQCLLIELGKNIIDMTFFAIVPSVGTLMFLIAGFIILLSAREGKSGGVETGKKIMTDTAIGIAIILSSWLIANFILKSLANDQISQTPWYTIQCKVGTLKDIVGGTNPPPPIPPPPTTGQLYDCNSNDQCVPTTDGRYDDAGCYQVCPTPPSNPPPAPGPGPGPGVQCPDSSINICQPSSPHACSNASCGQYSASIAKYATGGATASLLKAIMFTESSCNPATSNAVGQSYGLMELQVPTAIKNSQGCVTDSSVINSTWLTTAANSDAIICIAANYINSLVPACGTSPSNLAANYNGANACATSQDCTGSICGDSPPKAWECLYDDTAHTICNANRPGGGLSETRQYVPNVLYCVNNPGF